MPLYILIYINIYNNILYTPLHTLFLLNPFFNPARKKNFHTMSNRMGVKKILSSVLWKLDNIYYLILHLSRVSNRITNMVVYNKKR